MTQHLLFIDDSQDDVLLALNQLEQAGIQCTHRIAHNEAYLRRHLGEQMPDLILCDIVLSNFGPFAAWHTCRKWAPGVPFALYSGVISMGDRAKAAERGMVGYAEKDQPAEFLALVRGALGLP